MWRALNEILIRFEGAVHCWLVRHSVTALRIAVGVVFLGFGVLKYFPGASPAENLVATTIRILTFGLLPDQVAIVGTATLECLIGLSLLVGRGLRVTMYLLVAELLGLLSPLVLVPARLFGGPYHAPTLEGQYVLKDVILVAAGMVIAATGFRGAKIAYTDGSPPSDAGQGGDNRDRAPDAGPR